MAERIITVDYETWPIQDRPQYPPKPCGVAIWEPGSKPVYAAWDHLTNNGLYELRGSKVVKVPCPNPEKWARARLKDIWRGSASVLFHNGKFDEDVGEVWSTGELKLLPWERYHDTLFTLFLRHPHAPDLKLKPSSERILGLPPDEQDAVKEWLLANQPVPGVTISESDNGKEPAGKYIRWAPGDIVALYAIGDVVRTRKLHDHEYPELDAGEREAYDRERRLLPILLRNEREGMRVDLPLLEQDIATYTEARERAIAWLQKRLKAPELNIDSPAQLAEALEQNGIVTEWDLTEHGARKTGKDSLTADKFSDQKVYHVLGYVSRLATSLGTFMGPWARVARENNSYIYTNWNQVRGERGGARSGRAQCRPNFQNIPKVWDDKGDGYEHPKVKGLVLPELPLIRRYVLPDKGQAFGHRDYNQQELRILAHFENDKLLSAYNEDHRLDVHTYITEQIEEITGLKLERRAVKVVNFRTVYGGGASGLAEALGISYAQAKRITNALRAAIPGLKQLEDDLSEMAKTGKPLRTFGGRLYYCEPPGFSKKFKRMMTYEYKMLNYLIQPSAADTTKEALIRYHDVRKDGRFMVTVHDEINISAPKGAMKRELLLLREAMESLGAGGSDRWGAEKRYDLPMLSDAKMGPRWGELTKVEERR